MDWSRVKTILIAGFALLNGLLLWHLAQGPVAVEQFTFLAEPSREQVDTALGDLGLFLSGELPSDPEPLPVLEAAPHRLPGDHEEIWGLFFGETPLPEESQSLSDGEYYQHGGRSLLIGPGAIVYTDDRIQAELPADGDEPGDGLGPGGADGAGDVTLLEEMVKEGQAFIESHGGIPSGVHQYEVTTGDQVPSAGDQVPSLILRYPQLASGGIRVIDGYIGVELVRGQVIKYERRLWQLHPMGGTERTIMPAATLLWREGRDGTALAAAARRRRPGEGDEGEKMGLSITLGYIVVPGSQAEGAIFPQTDPPLPALVGLPVWHVRLENGTMLNYDATTGRRLTAGGLLTFSGGSTIPVALYGTEPAAPVTGVLPAGAAFRGPQR